MSPATRPPQGPRPKTRNVARRELDPARAVAFEAIRAVDERDAYANLVLPPLLRHKRLNRRDAAFATELVYGTLRGHGTYDAVLAACVDRPLADVDPAVRDALRLGVHQLLAMRVPAHAAVAATVDLTRAEVGQGAAGFVNAVLRKVSAHDLDAWIALVAPSVETDPDGHLAVATSHPAWVVRALRDGLKASGRDVAELPALLAADNARPLVTLVALPGLASVEELNDPEADPVPPLSPALSPLAVAWPGGPPEALGAIRDGRARVQDAGSQAVALALAAAPLEGPDGGRWLDLCAGPGGKAALLGATLADRVYEGLLDPAADGGLVAVDSGERRAELVRDALAPVEGKWEVRQGDGRSAVVPDGARFDRVLVDAPCTGLGALRRRPEARWRRTPGDVAALTPLQRELLDAAIDATRPGGVIAYVTCSPHPAETRLIVEDVLRSRTDVTRLDARAALSSASGASDLDLDLDLGPGPDVQLWPHVHGTDAMFLSLLRKNA